VVPGSPADQAGVKDHDVITKVGSTAVNQNTSLTSALSKYKVGDKVKLTIVRDGKTITLTATIGNAPNS
jgi:S1-C subfamily serine protease